MDCDLYKVLYVLGGFLSLSGLFGISIDIYGFLIAGFICIIFAIILHITAIFKKHNSENTHTIDEKKVSNYSISLSYETKKTNYSEKELKENFNRALKEYPKVIEKYEEIIKNFKYDRYPIGDTEVVYFIESSLAVYIGIDSWNGYGIDPKIPFYHVLLEELTPNTIFKFVKSHVHSCTNMYVDFFRAIKFEDMPLKYNSISNELTKIFYVNEKLPNLHIIDLAKTFEGVPYLFIIMELYDENGSAYQIIPTNMKNAENFVNSYCREINPYRKRKHYENYINNDDFYKKICELYDKHLSIYETGEHWTFKGKLRYFYINKMLKEFDFQKISEEIYKTLLKNKSTNIEWKEYGRIEGKWKSEFMVFEICENLYGRENVIYQHSPDFLGLMSYDVFIINKNIAIEYQGKQHFEPVEFFGGQEHFEQQVIRDKLKKQLSEENGIKLIYVNYDEDISEELIKNKIKEAELSTDFTEK